MYERELEMRSIIEDAEEQSLSVSLWLVGFFRSSLGLRLIQACLFKKSSWINPKIPRTLTAIVCRNQSY